MFPYTHPATGNLPIKAKQWPTNTTIMPIQDLVVDSTSHIAQHAVVPHLSENPETGYGREVTKAR